MSLSLQDYIREHGPKVDLPELLQLIESLTVKPSPKQVLHLLQQQSKYIGVHILPHGIARLMAAIGKQYNPQAIVDVNCRVGQVLHYCKYAQTRLGIDRSAQLIRLASHLYPEIKFLAGDILSHDIAPDLSLVPSQPAAAEQMQLPLQLGDTITQPQSRAFNLVITALPFGHRVRHRGRNEPLEKLLLERALILLDYEGVVVALSPVNVLTAHLYEALRKKVLEHYALDMIVSLPAGTLLHTSIPSCILVIRNGKPRDTVYLAEYQRNISEIVDNLRQSTGSLHIPLSRIYNRWDRHYFDPKFDEADALLRGENVKRLDEISDAIIRGCHFRSDERCETGDYLILTPRHLRQGRIGTKNTRRDRFANASAIEQFRHCIVQEGDILVGLISDPAVYIYRENDPPAVAGHNVAIIRAHDNKYIATYLQTTAGLNLFLSQVDRTTAGGTVRHFSLHALRNIKILILPLADLNAVSDEEIRIASVDKLKALEQELATYQQELVELTTIREVDADKLTSGTIREAVAIYQAQAPQSVEQQDYFLVLQTVSFLSERLDGIDATLQTLLVRTDQILNLVQSNQLEIRRIKETPRGEEEKLSMIYSKLNKVADQMTDQERTAQDYAEAVQYWLEGWDILDKASQTFLISAEFLFDRIYHLEDGDFSPFIIQYCRALENEILTKLFQAYHTDFHGRVENPDQFLVNDFENREGKTFRFAKHLRNDDRIYTLGEMSWIMQLMRPGGRTLRRSDLLQDFRAFVLRYFLEQIVSEEYLDCLQIITEEYRNQSAHPNILGIEVALSCQGIVRRTLNEFLASYLADGN